MCTLIRLPVLRPLSGFCAEQSAVLPLTTWSIFSTTAIWSGAFWVETQRIFCCQLRREFGGSENWNQDNISKGSSRFCCGRGQFCVQCSEEVMCWIVILYICHSLLKFQPCEIKFVLDWDQQNMAAVDCFDDSRPPMDCAEDCEQRRCSQLSPSVSHPKSILRNICLTSLNGLPCVCYC